MGATEEKIALIIEAYNKTKGVFAELDSSLKGISDGHKKIDQESETVFSKMKKNWVEISVIVAEFGLAVKEAWEYMEAGAKAMQSEATFDSVAEAAGRSSHEILSAMSAASKGTIEESQLMQKAIKGMTQGLSADDMIGISQMAIVAARTTGDSVSSLFDRITDAIANKMPRSLLQMGLLTKDQMRLVTQAMASGVEDVNLYAIAVENAKSKGQKMAIDQDSIWEKLQRTMALLKEKVIEPIGKGFAYVFDYLSNGLVALGEKIGAWAYALVSVVGIMWDWMKSGFKGGLSEVKKQLTDAKNELEKNIKDINKKVYGNEQGKYTMGQKPSKKEGETGGASEGQLAWLRDQQAAVLKYTGLIADLSTQEKEESITHDAAAERKLNAQKQIVAAIQAQLDAKREDKPDKNLISEEKAREALVQKLVQEKGKLIDLSIATELVTGKTREGNTAWRALTKSMTDYQMAVVDALEVQREISKPDAAKARVGIQEQQIKLLELEQSKVKVGSQDWYKYANQIEQATTDLYKMNRALEEQSESLSGGFKRGFQDYLHEAKTTFQQGVELAKQTAQGMESAFSDFFFDTMAGKLKSLWDYIKSFLQAVARAIANIMAEQAAQGIVGSISSAFGPEEMTPDFNGNAVLVEHQGGLIMHQGGYVPRFHVGGLSSDEVPAILQKGEYVVSRKGVAALDKINSGQAGGGVNFSMNVVNQTGTPIEAKNTGVKFDGEKFVVSVLLNQIENYGPVRHAISALR